jgi:PilZ domain-containing protein
LDYSPWARLSRGIATVSVKRFLKQRAVNIAVDGSYTLANWFDWEGRPLTLACRTSRVSPFRMLVDAPVVGRVGDRITTYFSDFGKLDGRISETVAHGFLLELIMSKPMREKLARKLVWLEKRLKDPSVRDARKRARIVPARLRASLTFADGTIRSCLVIDMSASGAAVSADVQPEIGTPLAVGTCVGRVVRHLHHGFAVQFAEPQDRFELHRRIARPAPPSSASDARAEPRSADANQASLPVDTTSVPRLDDAGAVRVDVETPASSESSKQPERLSANGARLDQSAPSPL